MSVSSQTEQSPKFTSMEEMKRWQAEREDRLDREHVRERILQRAAEREKQQQPKIKSPKSRRTKAGGS